MKVGIGHIMMIGLCVAGCARSDEASTASTWMQLSADTRVAFSLGDVEARLLFWCEDDLSGITAGTAMPYFDCTLTNIDDYNTEKYNTEKYYPSGNQRVYAAGFSPATLDAVTTSGEVTTTVYNLFRMPNRNGQDSTVLVSNTIVGSDSYTFHETLEFAPATARFIFRAIRSENLYQSLYVRHVTVKVQEDFVPNAIQWDDDALSYKATHVSGLGVGEHALVYNGPQLSTSSYTTLGVRYLSPFTGSALALASVSVEMSYNPSFPTGEIIDQVWDTSNSSLSVPLLDLEGNAVTAVAAGESYLITIIFDQDEFELVAQEVDWEWGGYVPVSVVVTQETTESTGTTDTTESSGSTETTESITEMTEG